GDNLGEERRRAEEEAVGDLLHHGRALEFGRLMPRARHRRRRSMQNLRRDLSRTGYTYGAYGALVASNSHQQRGALTEPASPMMMGRDDFTSRRWPRQLLKAPQRRSRFGLPRAIAKSLNYLGVGIRLPSSHGTSNPSIPSIRVDFGTDSIGPSEQFPRNSRVKAAATWRVHVHHPRIRGGKGHVGGGGGELRAVPFHPVRYGAPARWKAGWLSRNLPRQAKEGLLDEISGQYLASQPLYC
ncbi:hypothetical protein TOPH_07502, partial [Tolypocladium ophioglossoides CBS 100239]